MEEKCPECGAGMSSQDAQNVIFDCGSMYHRTSGDMLCPCDVDDEEDILLEAPGDADEEAGE